MSADLSPTGASFSPNAISSGMADDDRPPWPAAIAAILVAVALTMAWKHYSHGNTEHDQVRWDIKRESFQPEPYHSHQPVPPQLRLVVQIYARWYFTLLAGLFVFVTIRALAQRRQRKERGGRNVVDEARPR